PVLSYATMVGSGNSDVRTGIAVDPTGAPYVTGTIAAPGIPTKIFVAKLNPEGTALVYTTYLEGQSRQEPGTIAVDAAGSVYIMTSYYYSDPPSFPIRPPSGCKAGGAVAAKLAPDGASLLYVTFFCGKSDTYGAAIAADSSGNAYVAGTTYSFDLQMI